MTIPAISLVRVSKRYGEFLAVKEVSFTVHRGQVYGLLGPNGAGKTTLLRILSTLLPPTQGQATILGYDVLREPALIRKNIGVLTAGTGLYERLTPREILRYFLHLHGFEKGEVDERANQTVSRYGLASFADRACGGLSTGQRQKVLLARAMAHDPTVVILDEPTSGLDVLAARSIHELVKEARSEARAVLLSSHDMLEVELLCDTVGILSGGVIRAEGTVSTLRAQSGKDKLAEVFLHYLEDRGP